LLPGVTGVEGVTLAGVSRAVECYRDVTIVLVGCYTTV
jgi:hypothetical protein